VATGCNSTLQSISGGFQDSGPSISEIYRLRAVDHERDGELLKARMAWRVVARLEPDDASVNKKLKALTDKIKNTVANHYSKGVNHFDKGDLVNAQRQFLMVLRFSPRHRGAREYLARCLYRNESNRYKVKRGDSYIKIATRTYNDPTKAEIIAYFNNLKPDKPLLLGKVLYLPSLDDQFLVPRADIRAMADKAQIALDQKRYDRAIAIAGDILKTQPKHHQALRIKDQAHFEKGRALIRKEAYFTALGELKKVDPKHKGRDAAIDEARTFLQQQAVTEKMNTANALMKQKAYNDVINVTEEILAQNPGNDAAKNLYNAANYEAAKSLIEKEMDEIAIEHLRAIHLPYEDTDQLISQTKGRLNARAETHYRKGVMYFLNEELEMAIQAWQQTLALNPNHPKAGQDIENASKLLDRWRDLDTQK
jgi:tetratricopeptide (TPR) repeat protein